jgi:alanyl-tRNA synthetase
MKKYSVNELRELYLAFFEKKDHLRMKSFPLVPQNDKSLLLINAGMAPLKPYFTGQEKPPRTRITTCQKCIRTGDIENIGKTARHGTFFEMLGNFSFGDYFKEEAIAWAWEFLTKDLEIPESRLSVSVYEEDEEAATIWREQIGVPKERIFYMGKEDNFWEVGTEGPCGPCSEIYYDRGEKYGCDDPNCTVGCECDRYIEIWNNVFTQFNRHEDGTYTPLPNPNIDTGMGLERLAVIMQDVDSFFDIDSIRAIRDHICSISGVAYQSDPKKDVSIRVMTDHIRAVTFLASDGVRPSNEGRGYVMRRLLRRGIRHGKLLGINRPFVKELIKTVVDISKGEYTELEDKYDYIVKLLTVEEESFNKTIEQGLSILNEYIEKLEKEGKTVLDGASCFKLYDTYGFPIDLTKEILEEKNRTIDEVGFKEEMEKQRQRARSARAQTTYMGSEETVFHLIDKEVSSKFVGYTDLTLNGEIAYLTTDEAIIEKAEEGEEVCIIALQTPFYAESGGQIGDQGKITTQTGEVEVTNTVKAVGGKIVHQGIVVSGYVEKGQKATFEVDEDARMSTSRNHSATHLLQKALREVVGGHVEQAGSYVSVDRLRFDYTHFEALTKEQIEKVEEVVNAQILASLQVETKETSIDEARKMGAMALFGEKYGQTVRVVNMEGFSIELCGGTHLETTAQIGAFKIISETGVAAGTRRIEAVTGKGAIAYYKEMENAFFGVLTALKTKKGEELKKIETLLTEMKNLQKENEKLKAQMAKQEAGDLFNQVETIGDVKVLVAELQGLDMNGLRSMGDTLKDQLGNGVVVLASVEDEKVNLVAMATKGLDKQGVHCGNIISRAVKEVNGGGGGRPNMAQAGGKDPSKIGKALEEARKSINEQLKA